MKHSDVQV